jgi:two-component system sensor histidine kinase PilS (NtrC family)
MHVDLEARLKRLMLFRVVMVTTLLSIATWVEAVAEEPPLGVNPVYAVIVVTYVLTVLYAILLRMWSARTAQAYVQIAGDLLMTTALVHVAPRERLLGFVLLYPLAVLSATLLVSRRGAMSVAGLATLLYGGLLAGVHSGLLQSQGLSDVLDLPFRAVLYNVFLLGVACATVAFLGSYLAESLQHAGRQLQKAEVEVADLLELNQVIVDSIQSGLLMTDAEGRIRHLNAFGEGILGRRASELLGRSLRDVLGSTLLGSAELRARAASRALARLEIRYRHPGGADLDLGVSVTPLATEAARGGYLVVFQDLTDVRRLEAELRTNEKLAAVGEMAAQLAHEIRNPLGSIRGSAQVLAGEAGLSEEQGHLLTIISRESKRLSDTLNRFLFQARSTGRPRDVVNLRPLLEEAVTLLRNGTEIGPDHTVKLDFDEGPHLCLADPDQITQVFWNLARNALEAMPDGGDLVVRLRRLGDEVLFTVRDQGRGMPREEQRRVFEPFQSWSRMGTGLGLAIVYRIVREHGGDIHVRSAPSRGTEVEVRLPRAAVGESVEAVQ